MLDDRPLGRAISSIQEQHAFYIEALDPQPGESILDAGCGRGPTIAAGLVACPSARWYGVELRPGALAAARSGLDPAVALSIGDLRWLPYGDGSFEAIVSRDTLECLPDPLEAIQEMARVLRPGGRLLLCHWDWYTQVFNIANVAFARRLVDAFAETQQDWMEAVDPAMGRKLKGLAASVPNLETVGAGVVTLVESDWSDGRYGYEQSLAMAELLIRRGKVSRDEATGWIESLGAANREGSYLYSINHYWALARKR